MGAQQCFAIDEVSSVAAVRRAAMRIAEALGFDEVAAGRLGLVVTEAATNIVKHARHGQIVLRGLDENGARGCEVLALDNGPGMADLAASMRDGHSTCGTAGSGLGAMQRLADRFAVQTRPGQGTVLYLAVYAGKAPPRDVWEVGAVSLPKPGEESCGDGWRFQPTAHGAWLSVIDGLGHGPAAATAARVVLEALVANGAGADASQLVRIAHEHARGTRGAAMAVCTFEDEPQLVYAGVGNITGCVVGSTRRQQAVNSNGTVGQRVQKIQPYTIDWPADALLIMHSDGIATQWDLQAYPGLMLQPAPVIAAVLFRDFARGSDDATVVVLRRSKGDN